MTDLTQETNNWIVEDPAWANYSKNICTKEHHWMLYYGDAFFLKGKAVRFPVSWPNIAEHFYALQWRHSEFSWDTIFASYSLAEVKRFVDTMDWPLDAKKFYLRIRDEVTKEIVSIADLIKEI